MLKKLFSHSILYAIGPQIPKIIGIFLLPIITKYLTEIDYGVFGVISSYIGLISALQELGFSILIVNAFYHYQKNGRWKIIWQQLYGYLICWSLIYGLLVGVFLFFIIPEEAHENRWNIIGIICIEAAFFSTTITFGGRLFQLLERPRYIAMVAAIVGSLTIFLNLYTIAYLKMGFMGWYVSRFISSFVTFLFYIFPLLKQKIIPIFKFRKKFLARNLKVALPTIPHNYSVYLLNTSDRVVMDQLDIKVEDLGLYNLAYTYAGYMEVIGGAVGMAVGPFYAKLHAKKTKKAYSDLQVLTFLLQTLFVVGAFMLALWSKEIFQILISNDTLETAYTFAVIIVMGYAYRPMYWASVNRLFFEQKTNQLWKVSFIAGVLNVVLNLIFIPIFGIIAAPITTFVALMYLGFSTFFLKSYRQFESPDYKPLFWFIIILSLAIVVFLIKDILIVYKVLISLGVILILVFLGLKFWKRIQKVEI